MNSSKSSMKETPIPTLRESESGSEHEEKVSEKARSSLDVEAGVVVEEKAVTEERTEGGIWAWSTVFGACAASFRIMWKVKLTLCSS